MRTGIRESLRSLTYLHTTLNTFYRQDPKNDNIEHWNFAGPTLQISCTPACTIFAGFIVKHQRFLGRFLKSLSYLSDLKPTLGYAPNNPMHFALEKHQKFWLTLADYTNSIIIIIP